MKQRVITGVLLAALFIPVLFFSHTVFFRVVMGALATVATYEMHSCIGCNKKYMLLIPSMLLAFMSPFLANSSSHGAMLAVFIAYIVYANFTMVFSDGKITPENACVSFTTTVYISISFASIILIRNLEPAGYLLYIMVFLGAWMSDISAYFFGYFFGKHKLIPNISPKKTVEGAVGGMIGSALSMVIYVLLVLNVKKVIPFFPIQDVVTLEPNYLMLAISGAGISVISQLGDLSASAIKRHYGVKDYGKIFPGHGGVLDRFDSILSVAPLFYLLVRELVRLV